MTLRDAAFGFFSRPRIPSEDCGNYILFLTRRQARLVPPVVIAGTLVMIAMAMLDPYMLPDVPVLSVVARIAVTVPAAALILLYLRRGTRSLGTYYAIAASLPILFGTLGCLVVSRSDEPVAALYMTANNITIMFAMLMLGLPPAMAALTAFALIVIQTVLSVSASFASRDVLVLLVVISCCVSAVAFVGNWRMDLDRRRQFLIRQRDKELVAELSARNVLLERLSALDPLTGLSNRRVFETVLANAVSQASREPAQVVALAMLDVDHFKLFNDTHGHSAGDEALREIGRALLRACGENELAARYGGEEFVVVIPQTTAAALTMTGARLRTSVERLAIPHPVSPTARRVTISVGLAYADRNTLAKIGAAGLVQAADAALYGAKAKGRNTVVIHPCPELGTPNDTTPEGSAVSAGRRIA